MAEGHQDGALRRQLSAGRLQLSGPAGPDHNTVSLYLYLYIYLFFLNLNQNVSVEELFILFNSQFLAIRSGK